MDAGKSVTGIFGDYPLNEGYLLEFNAYEVT
jgi:hypothetical protein